MQFENHFFEVYCHTTMLFFCHKLLAFHFFFSVTTFSHRRSARIKQPILQKLKVAAKSLGVHPFTDFGVPWRPFWIFDVLMIKSKNLFS